MGDLNNSGFNWHPTPTWVVPEKGFAERFEELVLSNAHYEDLCIQRFETLSKIKTLCEKINKCKPNKLAKTILETIEEEDSQ